jgi:hypothetical protein
MDTNKPLYGWRGRSRSYALAAVIITAIAAFAYMFAAIANLVTNYFAKII